ncbi:MAG: CBS domain-containing protein [Deltaproteobacteria bacterium]|nr:MAG: CBS domain-containing protein [Deltaproteobacteria bacterium]
MTRSQPNPAKGRFHGRAGFVVAATVAGACTGLAVMAFRWLVWAVSWAFSWGQGMSSVQLVELPRWWLVIMPAAGGLLVGAISNWLAPETRGTGVPEVIEAVSLRRGFIRKRVAVVKSIVVALCLGSGGSAGREGPVIHVGSAIGSLAAGWMGLPTALRRTLVGCGAAAAISATFDAPVAGALFAGEVILGEFGVVSFSAIVVAAVAGSIVSKLLAGGLPVLVVPDFEFNSVRELAFHAGLGVASGIAGAGFVLLLDHTSRLFERVRLPPWLKPAIGGLAVGATGLFVPEVLSVGYPAINRALWTSGFDAALVVLLIAKPAATALTLGSGGSGGVFAPSLFLGGTLGALYGGFLHDMHFSSMATAGSYALVGMAACVAAVTRAPISAMLIVIELSGSWNVVLPVMLACILATLVADRLAPSVYHVKLLRRGLDPRRRRDLNLLRGERVESIARQGVVAAGPSTTARQLLERAEGDEEVRIAAVDEKGRYTGIVRLHRLLRAIKENPDQAAPAIADATVPPARQVDTLDVVLRLMDEHDTDWLAVVDDEHRPTGYVLLDGIVEVYHRRLFELDPVGESASLLRSAEGGSSLSLADGMVLSVVDVPAEWAGHTLRQLDLRRRHGLEVVLVVRQGVSGTERIVADAGLELAEGDRLLVLAKQDGDVFSPK